ncbi:site-specific integrase [Bacteroides fragilis]|uniref:site-specific integrase n=1 Tax=Bacteroides fragilis TaxID=817 RepID=UPI0015F71B63|nr:site-specific integrase [Bacteroides fragilis]MBA5667889.1 site-specific integrase [Bacteroides fragilis]
MNNELKVSFYLKREGNTERTETNPDAVYPIVGKIIIGNTIAQFGSKLKVEERLWSVKSGRAIGKSRVAVELNREINKINLSIHAHYRDILKRTGKVTAIEVKNAFQGIATAQKTLLILFGEMMEDFKGRIGIDRAQSTYKQYEVLYKQLKQFLREEYHVEDIPLTELDLPFIEALNLFFRVKRKMNPNTVKARIIKLNKVIRLALHRNIITRPPFEGFELEKTELKNKSLTNNELNLLMKTPLKSGTQRFIRDMFLFSTFTGLAYADLHKLSWKDIITEDDGSLCISANRQKSHTEFNVKLLNIPIQIMEYYKGLAPDGKVFPPMSLGQINVGLKRIARNCGINRALSFHQARYTFASQICLSQGVPIESVSRMLGHKHIQTTQRYARLNYEKISNDMQQLSARLSTKFNF